MSSGKKGGSPQTLRIIGVDPGTLDCGSDDMAAHCRAVGHIKRTFPALG